MCFCTANAVDIQTLTREDGNISQKPAIRIQYVIVFPFTSVFSLSITVKTLNFYSRTTLLTKRIRNAPYYQALKFSLLKKKKKKKN